MCELGKCVLAMIYKNTDANSACEEVCHFHKNKEKKEKEETMKTIKDIKRKQ